MADTARTLSALQSLFADNSAGDISAQDLRDFLVSAYRPQAINGFRLTLETGVPVSTSDQTGKTTVYLTPYAHNCIGIYDTSWIVMSSAEISLALGTLTSGKNYDVFAYNNSGTLALELSAAWTNDTTRADALTTQDGVYVKSGAPTRRYVGTIRTTSTTTTEDSAAKRLVWNQDNRVLRSLERVESGTLWTYNSTSWRQANANAANQVAVVTGLAAAALDLTLIVVVNPATGCAGPCGIGEDSSTVPSGIGRYSMFTAGRAVDYGVSATRLTRIVPLGYHDFRWLEACDDAGTVTFLGTGGGSVYFRSGLSGQVSA